MDAGDEDIRNELINANRDWLTVTAEYRKRRQDAVMKALSAGWSKYAIAQAMGVAGPTVDSIIKAAGRQPARPVTAERPARRPHPAPEPEALRPAAGRVPFREPGPEEPAPTRKHCTHPGVIKGVCPNCGDWAGKKS